MIVVQQCSGDLDSIGSDCRAAVSEKANQMSHRTSLQHKILASSDHSNTILTQTRGGGEG